MTKSFKVITHVPGGILSEKFGGKYTLGLGILSTAIFTLITPAVINWGKEHFYFYLITFSKIFSTIRRGAMAVGTEISRRFG